MFGLAALAVFQQRLQAVFESFEFRHLISYLVETAGQDAADVAAGRFAAFADGYHLPGLLQR